MAFGPDGFLYVAMGDGGPQEDPNGYSQSGTSFLGKMLRLDVDKSPAAGSDLAYAIPSDNPFCERKASEWHHEIWALGFREPWRFSFDRKTGDLWLCDVGQVRFEEVCIVRRGENHGWNVIEKFSDKRKRDDAVYTPPIVISGPARDDGFVIKAQEVTCNQIKSVCGDCGTSSAAKSKQLEAVGVADHRGPRSIACLFFSSRKLSGFREKS